MAENESLKLNHLILASLTAKTLKTGLEMLDIKAVKIM
jgi:Arginyl-tRNA synthetase